jgi:mannose-6-phosphate isomerase
MCRDIHALALSRFYDAKSGAVREVFDNSWSVQPAAGAGRVEPGHLLEWAWLLRQYEKVSGQCQDAPAQALVGMAMRHGFMPATGRIVDEIGEDGAVRAAASRCWPHCEALKALGEETLRGDLRWTSAIPALAGRLLDRYCLADLRGGWIDWLDRNDKPISKVMPASSFYHIYFGLDSALRTLDPASRE